jgi:hypothetical protein
LPGQAAAAGGVVGEQPDISRAPPPASGEKYPPRGSDPPQRPGSAPWYQRWRPWLALAATHLMAYGDTLIHQGELV